jgi:polyhydroxybutyrate depolymerase
VTNIMLSGGGAVHPVRIFVPGAAHDRATTTLPVVIDWPGLGLTGAQEAAVTGYENLAQQQGFVVVHPTGAATGPVHQYSWQLTDSYDPTRDDLAFADELIDTLVSRWCADPRRIYSTGYSNGALFTARLVCERADRIAAAVLVAGVYHPAGCHPSRPVPMYAYHGTADSTIPYDGGGKSNLAGSGWPGIAGFFDDVIPDQFADFAADYGCRAPTSAVHVGRDVLRYDYTGCRDATTMRFFEIDGGGHTWPDSPAAAVLRPLGATTTTVNATADGWAFLRTQKLSSAPSQH